MNIDLRTHKALIEALDELYPLRNPTPCTAPDHLWFEAGRRDVVELLLRTLLDQEENAVLVEHEVLGHNHV